MEGPLWILLVLSQSINKHGHHRRKRRIAPLVVTYHYVKFYVSIIIHLEVININVRNFNFPIGFYSNPLYIYIRGELFLLSANKKHESPVVAMFVNGSGRNEHFL
jgi:hypothetical protein